MTNLEYLKKNFNKFKLYDEDLFCELAFICKTGERCEGFKYERCSEGCGGCQFRNIRNAIDYLLQEHKESIKLKQWEYDLIETCYKCSSYLETDTLKSYNFFESLKEKGHLRGIDDLKIRIEEILDNCEVIE